MSELTEATFGCNAYARKTNICRLALGSALHVHERHEAEEVSLKLPKREHCICEVSSQIDFHNQGAICQNVSCTRENMVESIDCAPAKPSPAKRRCFHMFKKAYHEKWPFATIEEKGGTSVKSEAHSTVGK